MSTYEKYSRSFEGQCDATLKIVRTTSKSINFFIMNPGGLEGMATVEAADAAALALAVLEAGGVGRVPFGEVTNTQHAMALLAEHVGIERNKAATAAKEAARAKRRDELALELTYRCEPYRNTSPLLSRAIDRIIDAEDELAKERNK